jgi:hypothetical protein
MTLKTIPKTCKTGEKWSKTGQKNPSFGQNEAIFCRNFFGISKLPLWALAPINKPCGDKDLRLIMSATPTSIFRKSNPELKMR